MSRKASFLLTLLVIVLVVAALIGLVKTRPEPQARLRAESPTRVELTGIRRKTLRPVDPVIGRLEPARRAGLHFQISGELAARQVEPGAAVSAGQALLRLDDADFRDDVRDAEVALAREVAAIARDRRLLKLARRHVELARNEVSRQRKLGKQSLASQAGLDSALTALLQRETEVARLAYAVDTAAQRKARLETALDKARRRLARTRLSAPWAGTVNRVPVEVGDYLTPQVLALELVDLGHLDLLAQTGNETAAALRPGMAVEVHVGARVIAATIHSVQAAPEADTGTHPVRIRLPGAGLTPGRLASVALPLPARVDALVAPAAALLQDDGHEYLFVYHAGDGGGRLERRAVRTGVRLDGRVEILSGVEAGERVVARDVAFLADGQAVVARDPR